MIASDYDARFAEGRVIHAEASELDASDLSKIITFDVRIDGVVFARVTGELREIHHDLSGTVVLVGAHDRDDSGRKIEYTLAHDAEIAVWNET